MNQYTKETRYLDYSSAEIQALIAPYREHEQQEQIKALYLKVRDGWRYSPHRIGLTPEHYIASQLVERKEAHCIDKAIIYVACLRALDIPARLHLAKVANHIATESLEKLLGTNELAPHGLVDVYHNEKWVKCSPAFNKELCEKYKVDALDFDGTNDSVVQEYNKDDQKFMTYIEDYGHFEDVPFDEMRRIMMTNYPAIVEKYQGRDELDLT